MCYYRLTDLGIEIRVRAIRRSILEQFSIEALNFIIFSITWLPFSEDSNLFMRRIYLPPTFLSLPSIPSQLISSFPRRHLNRAARDSTSHTHFCYLLAFVLPMSRITSTMASSSNRDLRSARSYTSLISFCNPVSRSLRDFRHFSMRWATVCPLPPHHQRRAFWTLLILGR
jgi:hypothetical protein